MKQSEVERKYGRQPGFVAFIEQELGQGPVESIVPDQMELLFKAYMAGRPEAFKLGFLVSTEGFNGEYANWEHAPNEVDTGNMEWMDGNDDLADTFRELMNKVLELG